jgi:hypothetical protein
MNITTKAGRTQHIQAKGFSRLAKCGTSADFHPVRSKTDKAKPICKRCASK